MSIKHSGGANWTDFKYCMQKYFDQLWLRILSTILIPRGQEKVAAILQAIFWNEFFFLYFDSVIIRAGGSFAPNRW